MSFSLLNLLGIFLTFLFSFSSQVKAQALETTPLGYDEVFDAEGNIRHEYKKVVPLLEKRTKGEIENMKSLSTADFQGDNSLLHMPRMLSTADHKILKEGVLQRTAALQAFLADHYSGKKTYLQNQIIPGPVIDRILKRSTENHLEGIVRPEHMGFWYGPDLIRGPDNNFYVVEDNPGNIGGIGDLTLARETIFKMIPELKGVVNSPDPQGFFDDVVKSYLQRRIGGEKVVLVRYNNSNIADNEDIRYDKIFSRYGIETVVLKDNRNDKRYKNSLVADKDGVYLLGRGKREKVGFIIAGAEAYDLDPYHPATFPRYVVETAKGIVEDLKEKGKISQLVTRLENMIIPDGKTGTIDAGGIHKFLMENHKDYPKNFRAAGIPGLFEAFYGGKVNMNNSPGTEFIGDKEFYMYMDKLVRYYTHQEPIIKNIPTRSFRTFDGKGMAQLNTALVDEVFGGNEKTKDQYVVKKVDGRGGNAVWVGPKVDYAQFQAVKELVLKEPEFFIVQKYTPLSQVDGYIVDLRYHTDVSPQSVVIASVPWGRGVKTKGGNGKVNISDRGGELAVLIDREEAEACSGPADDFFKNLPAPKQMGQLRKIGAHMKKPGPVLRSKKRTSLELEQGGEDQSDQLYKVRKVEGN